MIKQNIIFIILLTFTSTLIFAQDINQMDANGKRHGLWKKNFEKTKQPRYEGEFSHGKEIGLFKFYKLVGKKSVLSATKKFSPDSDIAEVTFLSSKGKMISMGKMKGKLYVGKWKYYHNKVDTLMTVEHYNNNGKLDGEKKVFYDNGQLAESIIYKNGKIEGISTWYSLKGVKIKEFTYENDQLHGEAKYYDPKGVLLVEGQYKRDKKDGIWKYYKDGELYDEKDFTYIPKFKKKNR